jgi:hypothetical protein
MPPFDGSLRRHRIAVPMGAERSGKHPTIIPGRLGPAGKHDHAKETQMADDNRARGWLCAIASAALLAVSAAVAPPASAQDSGLQISSEAAQSVDLKTAPEVPAVARPADFATNRPTIPMADYVAAKNAAAAKAPGQAKPGAGAPPPATGVTLFGQVASTNESQSCCFPPDGDIATSAAWMVQVNNDVVTTLNWFTNAFAQRSLATFFGDGTNFIFDPRVIYDPYWDRFVVLADGCTACNGAVASVFELAISVTGDPTGSWWIYRFNPGTPAGDFADFPQMGMDLNSIILTYNDFPAAGGLDARTAAIAKAYLYNGLGFSVPLFGGSGCTMAPPYVLDNSGVDYVMTICPNGTVVWIASMRNTGLSNVSLNLWDNTVAVANHGVPPQAPQPGVNYPLDTGDNRFENRSLQVGSRILNTATVALGSFAGPSWYNFNIGVSPHTLVGEGFFFASGTSFDWHPAINANRVAAPSGTPLGEIFTTWMSTDPPNNVNVQIRAGGGIGDSPATGSTGVPVFTSSIPLTNQTDNLGRHRTGDYAYIATYPAAALGCAATELGILEGESSGPAAGLWGTHVGIVKHC